MAAIATAAIPMVLAGVSAGTSIYGGITASQAANSQAKAERAQGALEQQNAQDNATVRANQVRKFAAQQKLDFIANGVDFSGSAINSVNDTLVQGQKEVDAISRQGNAEANLAYENASITQAKGRAALIGGFGDAAGDIYKYNSQYGPKSQLSTN